MIKSIKFIFLSFWLHSRLHFQLIFCLCFWLVTASTPLLANESKQIANENNQTIHNILIIGDSISAGFGLRQDESWTNLLQKRINSKHYPYKIINGSLSGDTTGGGSKRIEKSLKQHQPAIVIIELGGNDGLRGFKLKQIQANLSYMIDLCLKNNHKVLLIGMRLPPNYGPAYTKRFSGIYQTLATEKEISLVPFLLKGIAEKPQHFQADQIHPNAEAQIYLLNNVWPTLQPMLTPPKS